MRVVVADDSVLLREGLVRILTEDGLDVVGVASDEDSALAVVAAAKPDLVVLDVRMPPTFSDEGIRTARQIRADHPANGVLLLS
ncbi:MAG: hypothetical protein QOF53_1480, partial [Nocardioidaceae bacterium]|nr:hypothetical protein [Nocardioidaceae bacterium]